MNTPREAKVDLSGSRQLFDLPDSEGVNASERILTKLCQRSFLRLWSATNIFTDEGFKDGKGSGKEFSDALVVFGRDVIIFSDKHVQFQDKQELSVAWARWVRRAVFESCKQLRGAMSWLQRFPTRVFLDAKCSRPLPVRVPTGDVRFHLVAVTRGTRDGVLKHRRGIGLGTLQLDSKVAGPAHIDKEAAPFVIGRPFPTKHFIHVFDEVAIELILGELDTTADFLDYLMKRESLLSTTETRVIASGEEDLFAAYLQTMSPDESEHVFFNVPAEARWPDGIVFDETWYAGLHASAAYRRKKQADEISYFWDELIDRFLQHGDPGIHERYVEQLPHETEQALRVMASESRFHRRLLSEAFRGMLVRAKGAGRNARLVPASRVDEPAYVFLAMPKGAEESEAAYRELRIAMLHAYVQTAKLKSPVAQTIVGIAVDHPDKSYQGISEDLFMIRRDEWTLAELTDLEVKRRELKLWGDAMEYSDLSQDEFPQAEPVPASVRRPADGEEAQQDRARFLRDASAAESKARKSRRRVANASRKKNRKR